MGKNRPKDKLKSIRLESMKEIAKNIGPFLSNWYSLIAKYIGSPSPIIGTNPDKVTNSALIRANIKIFLSIFIIKILSYFLGCLFNRLYIFYKKKLTLYKASSLVFFIIVGMSRLLGL